MSKSRRLKNVGKYLEGHAAQHRRPEVRDAPKPFVTISRQFGAGGVSVGERLGSALNRVFQGEDLPPWAVFDENLLAVVLEEHDLPRRFAQYMKEEKRSAINDFIEETLGLHPSKSLLAHKTSDTIMHLAHLGYAIIVGRAASVVTHHLPHGLHVRLIGSREQRVQHLMEAFDLEKRKAKALMDKEDQGRRDYAKRNFRADIEDPLLYDLVINTDTVPFERAGEIIAATLTAKLDLESSVVGSSASQDDGVA